MSVQKETNAMKMQIVSILLALSHVCVKICFMVIVKIVQVSHSLHVFQECVLLQ